MGRNPPPPPSPPRPRSTNRGVPWNERLCSDLKEMRAVAAREAVAAKKVVTAADTEAGDIDSEIDRLGKLEAECDTTSRALSAEARRIEEVGGRWGEDKGHWIRTQMVSKVKVRCLSDLYLAKKYLYAAKAAKAGSE